MLAYIKSQEELRGSTNRNVKGSRFQDRNFSDKAWDSLEVSVSLQKGYLCPQAQISCLYKAGRGEACLPQEFIAGKLSLENTAGENADQTTSIFTQLDIH